MRECIDLVPGQTISFAGRDLYVGGFLEDGRLAFVDAQGREAATWTQLEIATLLESNQIIVPSAQSDRVARRVARQAHIDHKKLEFDKAASLARDRLASVYSRQENVVKTLAWRGIDRICAKRNQALLAEILTKEGFPADTAPTLVFQWRDKFQKFGSCLPRHADKGRKKTVAPVFGKLAAHRQVKTHWLRPGGTKLAAYQNFKDRSHKLRLALRKHGLGRLPRTPSYTWFIKQLHSTPQRDIDEAQGKIARLRAYRTVEGSYADVSLELVEADACELPVLITQDVDPDDPTAPLARAKPWIVVFRHAKTRMVLGFYLGFGKPNASWLVAAARNAIRPKGWLKDPFWECSEDWPAFGVFRFLVVDNSLENHGEAIRVANSELRIETHFSVPGEPENKSLLERFFKVLKDDLVQKMPGAIVGEVYPSADERLLTFSECLRRIVQWIVGVYIRRPHPALRRQTPYQAWQETFAWRAIRHPPSYSVLDQVYAEFKPDVRLDKTGMDVNSVNYFDSDVVGRLMYLYGPDQKYDVKFNRQDLGRVWIKDPIDELVLHELRARDFPFFEGLNKYLWDLIRPVAIRPEQSGEIQDWEVRLVQIIAAMRAEVRKRPNRTHMKILRQMGVGTDKLSEAFPNPAAFQPGRVRAEPTRVRSKPLMPSPRWVPSGQVKLVGGDEPIAETGRQSNG